MATPPDPLDELATRTLVRSALDAHEREAQLEALGPRWSIANEELRLSLPGPMGRTGAVAAAAGVIADELDHHPRIVVEYTGLSLAIHTHDARAITVLDFVFAARVEQWLREHGWAT